jgi:hypothetical protein
MFPGKWTQVSDRLQRANDLVTSRWRRFAKGQDVSMNGELGPVLEMRNRYQAFKVETARQLSELIALVLAKRVRKAKPERS